MLRTCTHHTLSPGPSCWWGAGGPSLSPPRCHRTSLCTPSRNSPVRSYWWSTPSRGRREGWRVRARPCLHSCWSPDYIYSVYRQKSTKPHIVSAENGDDQFFAFCNFPTHPSIIYVAHRLIQPIVADVGREGGDTTTICMSVDYRGSQSSWRKHRHGEKLYGFHIVASSLLMCKWLWNKGGYSLS